MTFRKLGFLPFLLIALQLETSASINEAQQFYYIDLRDTTSLPDNQRYDLLHAATCVQGLANRDAPRVFLIFNDDDPLWLTRLQEEGGLCENWQTREIKDFDAFFEQFSEYVNGVVLYDPDPETGVISTSLVATTAAGVEGGIALRKDPAADSLYQKLVLDPAGPKLPVLVDLAGKFTGSGTIWETDTPSTGSAKCDAYQWAIERYVDSGRCDPTTLIYSLDLWGLKVKPTNTDRPKNWQMLLLANLDYAVSKKGFCYELSPWGDEIPNDDPGQPLGTDLDTYKRILHACNEQTGQKKMIKGCGFYNIDFKYNSIVGGKHDPVPTEWEREHLLSAYNCYSETDAPGKPWFSNASFYAALMPTVKQRRYVQNPPPSYEEMLARGLIDSEGRVVDGNYILLGMQDYDQCSWVLYWLAGDRYDDPVRGEFPINWMINPNAVDRVSVAMDYMYRHKSPNDYFCAGDSGAGYLNPSQLHGLREPSGYPSGVKPWQDHCRKYYRLFDYSITGWLLDGKSGLNTRFLSLLGKKDIEHYAPFSGDGVGVGYYTTSLSRELIDNCPVLKRSTPDDPQPKHIINYSRGVHFAWYRTILKYPRDIKALQEACLAEENSHNRRFLDMYTFYYLMRYYFGGQNNYRAAWADDTIPAVMAPGQSYPVTVTVRNDGWDSWTHAEGYGLGYAIVPAGRELQSEDFSSAQTAVPKEKTIKTGQITTFALTITAPKTQGAYNLFYDMCKEGAGWFRRQNNIEWKMEVNVRAEK
jgi:hypothetical protein